jgi:hypothetical protein
MQNNLVMKIKKVAALAGTAIMASSMMAPVMAATLASLPAPFVTNGVFDANIVVGSSGTAAGISGDLAGAMDVAAAFAQQASSTVTSAGAISLTRPMTPGSINSTTGYLNITQPVDAKVFNASVTGFEWMTNTTISYNDTAYPINELLSVGSNANLDNNGKYTEVTSNMIYNITSNGTTGYHFVPGLVIPIFGKNYQLISVPSANKASFGQMVENKALTFGSTVSITGKATVEVIDFSSTSPNDVLVKVTAANGTVMFNDFMSKTGTKDYTDYMFTLSNLRTLSSGVSTIDLSWSTSAFTLENAGNASALDPSLQYWTVSMTSLPASNGIVSNLSYIAFSSPVYPNNIELSAGENLDVMNYFNVSFQGWRDINTTTYSIANIGTYTSGLGGAVAVNYYSNESEALVARFNGITGSTITGNNTGILQLIGPKDLYIFQFTNSTNVTIKTSAGVTVGGVEGFNNTNLAAGYEGGNMSAVGLIGYKSWALFSTSNAWYNISYTNATPTFTQVNYNISLVNWTGITTNLFGQSSVFTNYSGKYLPYAGIKFVQGTGIGSSAEFNANATMSGILTLTEKNGDAITIQYVNNNIDSVTVAGASNKKLAIGEEVYSRWGSLISRTTSGINIAENENIRYANIWIGRTATETKSVSVGSEITGTGWTVAGSSVTSAGGVTPITPGIGASASAYTTPVILAKPTIIIGGGEANTLTAELAANGEGVTTAALLAATNKAYLQLIENAFGGSKTVLVIAGRDAKDTKLACQALAAHIAGTRAMSLTGTTVWLDTTQSSYTSVSVVAE